MFAPLTSKAPLGPVGPNWTALGGELSLEDPSGQL